MGTLCLRAFAALFALFVAEGSGQAANLTIFATGSMAEPLKQLGGEFSRTTGHTLTFSLGTSGVVLNRIESGQKGDVVVISVEAADLLQKEGRLIGETRKDVARSIFGAAVKAGAAKPDISTPEAFKNAVNAARSIAYPDPASGATSGIYLESLFQRLGIADAAKRKTVVKPMGADVAQAVASGEVELGLTFVSELITNKGVTVLGAFPAAIQNPTLYTAGVMRESANSDAARAFIAFVTSKAAQAELQAAGVEPASP